MVILSFIAGKTVLLPNGCYHDFYCKKDFGGETESKCAVYFRVAWCLLMHNVFSRHGGITLYRKAY